MDLGITLLAAGRLDLSTYGRNRALSVHFAVPIFDFFRCLDVPWALQPAVTPRLGGVRQKTGYVPVGVSHASQVGGYSRPVKKRYFFFQSAFVCRETRPISFLYFFPLTS